MIKRIIHIANPSFIKTENEQIVVSNKDSGEINSLPAEDLGAIIIDNPQITFTSGAVNKLSENNAIMVFCDKSHLPSGLLYPAQGNFSQTKKFSEQVNAKLPLQKRLWQEIIKQKILNQAAVLKKYDMEEQSLITASVKVISGDKTNREGTASRYYWKTLFKGTDFKREREGDYPNNLLNFGYAIVRSIVARAICAAGLHPSLGIHHKSLFNAFCLADDLMEPYRQFVDDVVYSYYLNPVFGKELNKDLKKMLIEINFSKVIIDSEPHPLFIAINMTVNSLMNCYSGKSKNLLLPELCN